MDIATFVIATLNPPQQHEEYKAVLAGWQAYFDRMHMIVPKEKHAEFERILQERMARKKLHGGCAAPNQDAVPLFDLRKADHWPDFSRKQSPGARRWNACLSAKT